MIDRDKVLPSVFSIEIGESIAFDPDLHNYNIGRLAGSETQRDADWERGMLWLTALKELLTVAAHSNNCGVFVNIGDHVEFNPDGCTCPHGRATALLAQLFAQKEER